jgi:hypothetical protein
MEGAVEAGERAAREVRKEAKVLFLLSHGNIFDIWSFCFFLSLNGFMPCL